MSDRCCDHWPDPSGPCGAVPAKRYMNGDRCAEHTPAALAGHPEPCPPPDSTLAALLARIGKTGIGAMQRSTVLDERAVLSSTGRRASVAEYRAAQQAREDRRNGGAM